MSLKEKVGKEMVDAMKAGDSVAKEALRSLKTAIVNAESEKGSGGSIDEAKEMQIVNKLVKQRKDSADILLNSNRTGEEKERDIENGNKELAEAEVIAKFLPEQMSEDEVKEKVLAIIAETGAESMRDMGKVMGRASKELAGKADGKLISTIVKAELS